MSNVKILVALLAACILVMPAFSMPDDGNPTVGQNSKAVNCPTPMMDNKAPAQQPCPCMNPIAGPDGKAPAGQDGKAADGPKSMMGNNAKTIVCLTTCKVIGQDGQQIPSIGPNGDDGKQILSMMGNGAQNPQGCPCQKPMIGPNGEDGKQILSMMGNGAQNPQGCPCQKPMIGPNGEDGKQKICNDQNSKPDELEQDNQDNSNE